MTIRLVVAAIVVLFGGFSFDTLASADSSVSRVTSEAAANCAGLLVPADIQYSQSFEMAYAFSNMSRQTDNTEANGNGNYLQLISGAFAYKREKDRAEQLGIRWQLAESSSYIARYLPANQSSDYLACVTRTMSNKDGAVGVYLQDTIGGTAHFILKVREAPQTGGRRLVIQTNGAPQGEWQKDVDAGSVDIPFTVSWPDPAKPLLVRAQMEDKATGRPIGSQSTFVVWPEPTKRIETHISDWLEVRHPNGGPACDCVSDAASIIAADDEVLLLDTAKVVNKTLLKKTWGKQDIACDASGIEYSTDSDASAVTAAAFCKMGQADENPGIKARFMIKGVHVTMPRPDPQIPMVEVTYR